MLTHLMPGTDPEPVAAAAGTAYPGPIDVAVPEFVINLHEDGGFSEPT